MTAIALAIVWHTIVNSKDIKTASKPAQDLGYGIATVAIALICMLAIKELFK